MKSGAFLFSIWMAMLTGCTMTSEVRKSAQDLSNDLLVFENQQRDRIQHLNQNYQDTFAKLMNALSALSDVELRQGRDGDAQSLSDALIADDKTSLIGILRGKIA